MNFEELVEVTENPDLEWKNISDEMVREYGFHDGSVVSIKNPVGLIISPSGGHTVVNEAGDATYIPYKWNRLSWRPMEGAPPVAF